MKEVKTVEEFEEAKKEKKVLVVDFYTSWCGPCKMVSPVLEELSKGMEEQGKDVAFCKIDCDVLGSVADDYKISVVPTVVLFNKGKEVDGKITGARSKDKYADAIDKALEIKEIKDEE